MLTAGKEGYLELTIIDVSKEELSKVMAKFPDCSTKPADFSLVGLINKRLIPAVLMEAGLHNLKGPVAELTGKSGEIVGILTDWRFKSRTKSWPSAGDSRCRHQETRRRRWSRNW